MLLGCSEPPCDRFCARARQCQAEVLTALVERQPGRSATFAHVRRHYRDRLGSRVIAACRERCAHLGRTQAWRLQIGECLQEVGCAAFARCAAPVLEP